MKQVAEALLAARAVKFDTQHPFTFHSGTLSPMYVDCRLLFSTPELRNKITGLLVKRIKATGERFDAIAGMALAGVPAAVLVAAELRLPLAYLRTVCREGREEELLQGEVKRGWRLALIDDMLTTGRSSLRVITALRQAGCRVNHCFAVFNYGLPGTAELLADTKVTLVALTDLREVLAAAAARRAISAADAAQVRAWAASPWTWTGPR